MPRAENIANRDRAQAVWEQLQRHAGERFITAKGLPYTYCIRGWELFVDRRAKSITFSTVAAALRRIDELLAAGEAITGPKMIGCYGASYLYPVFLALGVLPAPPQTADGQLGMDELACAAPTAEEKTDGI